MRIPALEGVIRRRVLVNFRVHPAIIQRELPAPFHPKLVEGWAIAGVCLIRLEKLRPKGLPACVGLSSDGAAHRVAVTWTEPSGGLREGVYILRRETDSALIMFAGGRLFPGEHHRAQFTAHEDGTCIDLRVSGRDGEADIWLRAKPAATLPTSSCFASIDAASAFFAAGSVGYSPVGAGSHVEGLELRTTSWDVDPLHVESVYSRYFADPFRFPRGTVEFDSALVMRNIAHEWHPLPGAPVQTCCS